MAKVEQKVGLDTKEYVKGAKELSRTAKTETDRVGKEFQKAGDDVKQFADKTKKETSEANGSFKDLAKGFRASIAQISAAGAGLAIGAAITKELKSALDFEDIVNKTSARLGLNKVQEARLQNQLLDVSSRRNVEEEEVSAAADVAISQGASIDEAVKFADVIASATKSIAGLEGQSATLADQIAKDIRARGGVVTGEAAQRSIEAIIAGTRSGIGNFNEVLDDLRDVAGPVQQRAGLTQKDLVDLLSGAGGVAADPDLVNDAVKSLIKATDSIETRGAIQGVLGTQLRDTEGNFQITAKNLEDIANTLEGIGTEQQQRALLQQIPGFDERSAEGLLALVRDREGFGAARAAAEADVVDQEAVFDKATSGTLERIGRFFNQLGNQLRAPTGDRPQIAQVGKFGQPIGKTQAELDAEFAAREAEVSPLARRRTGGQNLRSVLRTPTTAQQNQTTAAGSTPQGAEVNVKVEIDSKDPGLMGRPKATEIQRQTGGL